MVLFIISVESRKVITDKEGPVGDVRTIPMLKDNGIFVPIF
jgi:hypothetical protein